MLSTTYAPNWLDTYQAAYPLNPVQLSLSAWLCDDPYEVAVLGAARSYHHTNVYQSAIGGGFYAYADNPVLANGAWSIYGECYRVTDVAGRNYGAELCVNNLSGVTHKINPYDVSPGATICFQANSGNSFGRAQQPGLSPASAAYVIFQNTNDSSAPFESGIVALANSIALNTNGFSEVLSMPALSGLQWYTPGTSPASYINCTTTSPDAAGQILLQNSGVAITGGPGASPTAMFVTAPGSSNFITFTGGVSTISPSIGVAGADGAISLVLTTKGGAAVESAANLTPTADNAFSLGVAGARWSTAWFGASPIVTSDVSLKTDIAPLPSCLPLLLEINPITSRFIDGGRGQRGRRTHWNFPAGEVKKAMDKTGLDFGGYVLGEDGTEGLRPDQLLAVLWKACQEMAAEITALKTAA